MNESAIKIENVSKLYNIGTNRSRSLIDSVSGLIRRRKIQQGETEFWALKDVSFEVNKGEVLGIVGRNGAGKSTILKILSRITEPTHGRIEINGRMGSLLEVGTGFHPDLTGRENIFLNGSILGMKRAEIKNKFDEIVAFSGIEKFLDTPVKRYSSGMYVRLAFAVAAHLEPEILIIDEVLAVGDAAFQKRCLGKMKEVAHTGRTVLFVSHHMGMVRELCTKGILLKGGELAFAGSASETVDRYIADNNNESVIVENNMQFPEDPSLAAQILEATLLNARNEVCDAVDVFDDLYFQSIYSVREPIEGLSYNIIVERNGEPLFLTFDTDNTPSLLDKRKPGVYFTRFKFPKPLKAGRYTLKFGLGILRYQGIHNPNMTFTFDVEERSFNESLKSYGSSRIGVMATSLQWELKSAEVHGKRV